MPRIHDLPQAEGLTGAELAPVFQGGRTRRVSAEALKAYADGLTTARTDAEAQAAYEAGRPIRTVGRARLTVVLPLAPEAAPEQNWRVLDAARDWACACKGRIDLMVPDGFHRLHGDSIEVRQGDNELSLKAGGLPDAIAIAGVDFGANGPTGRCPVTVTLAEVLPGRVAPGFPIGMQAVHGDSDAAAVTGALLVETIAADRKSFTATFWLKRYASAGDDPDLAGQPYQPADPTQIAWTVPLPDGGVSEAVNGVTISQAIVPRAALLFEGGWNGRTTEGALCAVDGGVVRTRHLGFAYAGQHDDTGCLAFVKHPNSTWYSERDVFCGGPEKVVRVPSAGVFRAQLSCFGGGAVGTHPAAGANAEVLNAQEGGEIHLVRCSVGGAKTHTVVGANKAYLNVNQCFVAGGTSGVRVANYASADLLASRVSHGQRGLYAIAGTITASLSASISHCYLDIGWAAAGFAYGNPARSANYISATPQHATNGGGWFQVLIQPLHDPGTRISAAPKDGAGKGGIAEATLTGAGWLDVVGPNENLMGTIRLTARRGDFSNPGQPVLAATTATGLNLGTSLLVQTAEPTNLDAADGKVTLAVFPRGDLTYLRVVNRTTSSAVLRVYSRGDLALGPITQLYPPPTS